MSEKVSGKGYHTPRDSRDIPETPDAELPEEIQVGHVIEPQPTGETDNEITVHYKLLTRHDPNNAGELRRYSCSECDDDIFNINIHAQMEHKTIMFDVDPEEAPRELGDAPFHPCGVLGCTFNAHSSGPHSWQPATRKAVIENEIDEPTA